MADAGGPQHTFNLTPPNADERAKLEKGLTAEEREVLLHHGTEAPFCGGLLNQKSNRHVLLPSLRPAPVPAGNEV